MALIVVVMRRDTREGPGCERQGSVALACRWFVGLLLAESVEGPVSWVTLCRASVKADARSAIVQMQRSDHA